MVTIVENRLRARLIGIYEMAGTDPTTLHEAEGMLAVIRQDVGELLDMVNFDLIALRNAELRREELPDA